ncbi:unnamed protein product [Ectocarpus sp. CCAP 1310/34]|nr:unnamed protein product [Ectocarpus sp. CCAP 1310/34]
MPQEVQNGLRSWFQEATDTSEKRARANREKQAAAKRAKRVEGIANIPAAPEREERIERDRAVVSLAKRRESKAKAGAAAGKKFSRRGAVSKRTPKKEVQVSVLERIKKYPNETLYRSRTGTLKCRACFGKEIKNFSYRVDSHIDGKKHKERVAMTLETDGEDQVFVLLCRRVPVLAIVDCAIPHATTYNLTMGLLSVMLYVFVSSLQNLLHVCLKRSEEQGGTYGDSLSDKDKLTQIKAVKGCLAAGVLLNALGNPVFEKFLAHVNVNLPSSGHLAEHIPLILEEEVAQRVLRLSMLKKSMTADDIAAGEGVKEALFVGGVLSFIAPETSGAKIKVLEDNKGALALIENPFSSARSKHINVRFHFIRELFKSCKITAEHVPTGEQHADMLTKVLGREKLEYHWKALMNLPM